MKMMDRIIRLIASLIMFLCAIGVVPAQDRMNEFVVTVDESHNPMTIYSSYGATPKDGVVIINSTIRNLEFGIMSVAKERLRRVVPDKGKNRYVLIIQPNDSNYKQYTITINAKGYKQGKIDSVVVTAGSSSGYIVNPKDNSMQSNTIGGHEYVDLGLPSGTLWATCNVGASKPEGTGYYFAWGETLNKNTFTKDRYKYMKNGDVFKLTKYCTDKLYGYRNRTDGLTTLEVIDDVASSAWGNAWCTPTKNQWEELRGKCRWTWTSGGCNVVGPNGNSIFLPAKGYIEEDENNRTESEGAYWSTLLYDEYPSDAWALHFTAESNNMFFFARHFGLSVRPVCSFRK